MIKHKRNWNNQIEIEQRFRNLTTKLAWRLQSSKQNRSGLILHGFVRDKLEK